MFSNVLDAFPIPLGEILTPGIVPAACIPLTISRTLITLKAEENSDVYLSRRRNSRPDMYVQLPVAIVTPALSDTLELQVFPEGLAPRVVPFQKIPH